MHYIFKFSSILYTGMPLKGPYTVDRIHSSKDSILFAIKEHRRQVEHASKGRILE